jgi:hypothetical protein
MSNWKIAMIFTGLATSTVAYADKTIPLSDGKPLLRILGGDHVKFDGRNIVQVWSNAGKLKLRARTPATLMVSPSGELIVHNYGDGSGQVYDIAVYRLRGAKQIGIGRFKERVLRYARSFAKCKIRPDQISYIADRWSEATVVKIRTEDWSRRSGCSHVNRTWTFKV